MTRRMALLLAALAHLTVWILAVLGYLHADDNPPVFERGIICIFEGAARFNRLSLLQGSTEREANATLDVPATELRVLSHDNCVRYQYSNERAVMLLFQQGKVSRTWSVDSDFVPEPCGQVVERTVRIKPRAWYEGGM